VIIRDLPCYRDYLNAERPCGALICESLSDLPLLIEQAADVGIVRPAEMLQTATMEAAESRLRRQVSQWLAQ
jgi:hypothetical protein